MTNTESLVAHWTVTMPVSDSGCVLRPFDGTLYTNNDAKSRRDNVALRDTGLALHHMVQGIVTLTEGR